MPYCSQCGHLYKFGIKKCPKCRTDLQKISRPGKSNINQSDSVMEKKEKKDKSETPVAPIAKRISAGAIDLIIGIGFMYFIIRIVIFRYVLRKALVRGILSVIIVYALSALYFLLRDSLRGKSFGKLILALTVINIERQKPADLADSILRNSILAVIIIPFIGWIIFCFVLLIMIIQIFLGKEQRIGDRFAHTKVIEDKFLNNLYKKN